LTLADEETKPNGAGAGALTITLAADEISPASNQKSGNDVQDAVADSSVSWPVVREQWEMGTVAGHHAWHASQALPMVPCEVSATPTNSLSLPQDLPGEAVMPHGNDTPSPFLSAPGNLNPQPRGPSAYGLLSLLAKELLADGLENALLASAHLAEVARKGLQFLVTRRFKVRVTLNRRGAVAAAWAPLVIVLMVAGFTAFQVWHQGHVHVVAATTGMDHRYDNGAASKLIPPALASHRQITDRATLFRVEGLSRYEIPALRRQAIYGDDSAALVMGMLYETGRFVPQSCPKAAEWVMRSANWGNAAAQYNLGLRYRDGDGVTANQDEAKEWLQRAADHRYSNATIALGKLTSGDAASTYAP
jgi:Sel1 repeat